MIGAALGIAGAVGGLAKLGLGAVQTAQAKKARKALRDPGAEVTQATLDATARARNLAAVTYVDPRDVEASSGRSSDIIAEATRRGTGIDNVAEAYRMEQEDQGRRHTQAANEFYTNNARYIAALGNLAGEQTRVQQYRQGRFQQDVAATGALATAGQENIVGGIDGIAAAGINAVAREMPSQSTTTGNATTTTGMDPLLRARIAALESNYMQIGPQAGPPAPAQPLMKLPALDINPLYPTLLRR